MNCASRALRSTVAIAVAVCCFDAVLSPQSSKADDWQDSLIPLKGQDPLMQMWLRYIQIGMELGTPYFCKGMPSAPESFDVIAKTGAQFKKEFGVSFDDIQIPEMSKNTAQIIAPIYALESMKRNCPEVDRIQWMGQNSN